jgi:hypothetical protein
MHAAHSPVAITDCGADVCQAMGQAFITTCYYHKPVVYYSRTMAYSSRTDMLFSSGDFPRTLSSILSGEGFDEREQGKSPLALLKLQSRLALPAPAPATPFQAKNQ